MRKTCLLATFLTAGAAWAQEAVKPPKVAIIDLGRVSAETVLGKGYATQLDSLKSEIDSEGTKKQNELQKMDVAIKALEEELQKQGSVLSPEAADKKRQEIVRKTRERQAFLEDGQADLQRMRDRAQQQAQNLENEFQTKIKPHIDAVVKEKGIHPWRRPGIRSPARITTLARRDRQGRRRRRPRRSLQRRRRRHLKSRRRSQRRPSRRSNGTRREGRAGRRRPASRWPSA